MNKINEEKIDIESDIESDIELNIIEEPINDIENFAIIPKQEEMKMDITLETDESNKDIKDIIKKKKTKFN